MNKYFLTLATAFLAVANTTAQNVVDAAHFGASEITGTARYRAMAGAFGALGGDPSAMTDNPAGMAVYRGTNVFTITPQLSFTGTKSYGTETMTDDKENFAISNMAAVFSFKNPTSDKLVNFNVGVGLNRSYSNNSRYRIILDGDDVGGGFGDYLNNQANHYLNGTLSPSLAFDWNNTGTLAPFLSMMAYDIYAIVDDPNDKHSVIDPMAGSIPYQGLVVNEKTRLDHYTISAAANIDDYFYIGATMQISDYNSTIVSNFSEDYDYNYEGSYIDYNNNFETKGSGIGFNVGLLWMPIDNWRIGAAVHTPTWTTMTEFYDGAMVTDDERVWDWSKYYDSWKYEFSTPWEYQFSTAFILGTHGLLSFEYDMRDFTSMRYSRNDEFGLPDKYFNDANTAIKEYMKMQHTLKVGAEWRVTRRLSARAGFATVSSPYTETALKGYILDTDDNRNEVNKDLYSGGAATNIQNLVYYSTTKPNYQTLDNQYYITCGLGWSGKQWYTDLAFVYHKQNIISCAYPDDFSYCDPVNVDLSKKSFDLTVGYRF